MITNMKAREKIMNSELENDGRERINVHLITQSGGGFSEEIVILAGTRLADFVRDRNITGDFLVAVNRETQSADYIIQAGDRISATAHSVKGAI